MEDEDEAIWALGRMPGRFYVTKRFPYIGHGDEADLNGKSARFAFAVEDDSDEVTFENENGWEVTLRETPTRQQLKAIFTEDDRNIRRLVFQRFSNDGKPIKSPSFSLTGDEVGLLEMFLALIRAPGLHLGEGTEEDKIRVPAEMARQIVGDPAALSEYAREHPEVLAAVIKTDVSAPEVIAIARRKQVLEQFEALLGDVAHFDAEAERLGGKESVWQSFIEANPWLIGSTIAPQFLHSFSEDALQQTVVGSSIGGVGKRPDAVLRTAGAISALVLAEIKHHRTPLLASNEYRSGCWAVHGEIAGSVSQCQATAHMAERSLAPTVAMDDEDGFTRDRAFLCRPRTVLIAGSLEQFRDGDDIHHPKFESFERFRRGLRDPEILTFDELYARAELSVRMAEESQGLPPEASGPSDFHQDEPGPW